MRALTAIASLILFLLNSPWCLAHDKSDVITLYNGDRITGEIKGMAAGRLQINTDYSDSMFIEWPQIARIDSRYNFEVRLESSERLYGNVANADSNGKLQFTSITDVRQLELLEVVELRPIEETFEDRLNYSLGATLQLEPELRTNQLSAEISYEDRESITLANGRVAESVTKTTDGKNTLYESTASAFAKIEHQRWTERGKLYRTFTSSYEFNEALGNDGRLSVGTGFGRYFIDRPGMRLNSSAGIQAILEKNALTDSESNNPDDISIANTDGEVVPDVNDSEAWHRAAEAFIQGSWRIYDFGDNDMDITITGNLYPSLSDWGRVRASAGATVDWEVYSDVYWTVSAQADFDSDSDSSIVNDAPSLTRDTPVSTFDYMVTMGLSWKP